MDITLIEGIIIGTVGGFLAGIAITILAPIGVFWRDRKGKRKVYRAIGENTRPDNPVVGWATTLQVVNSTKMTIERVRHLCSIHPDIQLDSTSKFGDPMKEIWVIGKAH